MDRAFDALLRRLRVEPRASCCATASAMLVVFVAVLAATVQMFSIVPNGFIPDQDNDSMFVNLQAAQGTSFYDMAQVDAAGRPTIVIQEPVRRLASSPSVGGGSGGGGGSSNNGRMHGAADAARAARPLTAQQIAQQLRPQLLRFPGFRGFVGLPPSLQIGGRMGNQNLQHDGAER